MKKRNKMKTKEILIRLSVILLSFVLAHYVSESGKQILSIIGFSAVFIVSLWLHKHFFPFVTLAIACYLMASGQELWSESYTYLGVTKFLWTAGNILLAVGFVNLGYRTLLNISEND